MTPGYVLLWPALIAYLVHLFLSPTRQGRLAGWAGSGLTALAWIAWTWGLIARGLRAGHWPLTNRYEFALCLVWAILSIYLLLEASGLRRQAGGPVLGIALLVASYALSRPADERAIRPLLPVLRSMWLQVHVITAALGYGAFGVAAGLGLLRLVDRSSRLTEGFRVEQAIERAITLGFPWLTLSILTGAIWAQRAWGRYWGWDPKEIWSLVLWLWYLMVLHLCPLRRWRGLRLAVMVIIGFGLMMFTFAGFPWLVRTARLESLHGF
ncbi:MAG: cytochrome c biogenesis protein CcsA [Anaerolineae bacterium]|nr:cytochrome c biogenesis protein CcsA [Anaerolineae bacterium]